MVRAARPMPAQFTTTRGAPSFSTTVLTEASVLAASATLVLTIEAADLLGLVGAELVLQIEDRDLGAGRGQCRGGGAAQSRCAAGDDGGLPLDVHSCPSVSGRLIKRLPPPCQDGGRCQPSRHEHDRPAGRRDAGPPGLLAKGPPDPGQSPLQRGRGGGVLLRHGFGYAACRSAPPCSARWPISSCRSTPFPTSCWGWATPTMPRS